MITRRLNIGVALVSACLTGSCVSAPEPGIEAPAPAIPAVVVQNLSRESIAVYLVDDARESLLGRVYPLRNGRFVLGDRVFTTDGGTVNLAIVRNFARTMRPSLERGTYLSAPIRRVTLASQTWVFTGDDLWGR